MKSRIPLYLTMAGLMLGTGCKTVAKKIFPSSVKDDYVPTLPDRNGNGANDLEEITDYVKENGIDLKFTINDSPNLYTAYYIDIPGDHPATQNLQIYFPGMKWLSVTVNDIENNDDPHFPLLTFSIEDADDKVYAFGDAQCDGMYNSLDTYRITGTDLLDFEACGMDNIPADRKVEVDSIYPMAVSASMEAFGL